MNRDNGKKNQGEEILDRIVYEEMNLCEFPFAALTTQRHLKPLIFSDAITLEGHEIQRIWKVDGSLSLGTPIAIDEEALMVLLSFTTDLYNVSTFSTYRFCKVAGWPTNGRCYKMFQDSMLRIAHTTITATNSFYGRESKRYFSSKSFHIFDELHLYGMETTGIEEIDQHIWDLSKNQIKFSDILMESMQKGNVKPTNLDFYLLLRLPISKRLYRYLDKQFYAHTTLVRNTKTLGFEHIGLSKNYNAFELKRELDKGLSELEKAGYIKSWIHRANGVSVIEKVPGKAERLRPIIEIGCSNNKGVEAPASGYALVVYMHKLAGVQRAPNKLELDQAGRLIRGYSPEVAKFIVDYALEKISRSRTKIQVFGIVMQFEKEASEIYFIREREEEAKQKKAKEQTDKEAQEKRAKDEKEKREKEILEAYEKLPAEERAELERRGEEKIKEEHPAIFQKQLLNPFFIKATAVDIFVSERLREEGASAEGKEAKSSTDQGGQNG